MVFISTFTRKELPQISGFFRHIFQRSRLTLLVIYFHRGCALGCCVYFVQFRFINIGVNVIVVSPIAESTWNYVDVAMWYLERKEAVVSYRQRRTRNDTNIIPVRGTRR